VTMLKTSVGSGNQIRVFVLVDFELWLGRSNYYSGEKSKLIAETRHNRKVHHSWSSSGKVYEDFGKAFLKSLFSSVRVRTGPKESSRIRSIA